MYTKITTKRYILVTKMEELQPFDVRHPPCYTYSKYVLDTSMHIYT